MDTVYALTKLLAKTLDEKGALSAMTPARRSDSMCSARPFTATIAEACSIE